jgi:hypothetical protein
MHQQSAWAGTVRQWTWVGTTRRAARCGRFGETARRLSSVRPLGVSEAGNAAALSIDVSDLCGSSGSALHAAEPQWTYRIAVGVPNPQLS